MGADWERIWSGLGERLLEVLRISMLCYLWLRKLLISSFLLLRFRGLRKL